MLANFGNNGWGLFDDGDTLELAESKMTNPADMYEKGLRYHDEQVSKGINLQTGTSDEKAFVGGAEVHERQLEDVIEYDMLNFQNHFNEVLKPFLTKHGYPFTDEHEGKFLEFIKRDQAEAMAEEMKKKELEAPYPGVQQNQPPKPGKPVKK